MLIKIETKLNKNNKYRNQIEYRTLTLTRGTLLGWHVDILKKIQKNHKVTRGSYCSWSLMI